DVIVATADRDILQQVAPESLQRRGPWRFFTIVNLEEPDSSAVRRIRLQPDSISALEDVRGRRLQPDSSVADLLARAYRASSVEERVSLCREAAASAPDSAVAALALASACREQQDLEHARAALDGALRLAPDWEAAHYESGKF